MPVSRPFQPISPASNHRVRGGSLPGWPDWLPKKPFAKIARHSMDFWLSSEDLPRPENRIRFDGKRMVLAQKENYMGAHRRLGRKLEKILIGAGAHPKLMCAVVVPLALEGCRVAVL